MVQSKSIIEKVSLIKESELNPNGPDTGCYFLEFSPPSEKKLKEFKKKYHFLPKAYLDFLEKFGAPRISWLYILPLENEEIPDISSSLASLQEYWDYSEGYLPFAEDGGSYIYCFDQYGKVWGFSLEGYDEKPDFFANSFVEFMDECILGKRYEEFIQTDKNPFYDFLKKQGWV